MTGYMMLLAQLSFLDYWALQMTHSKGLKIWAHVMLSSEDTHRFDRMWMRGNTLPKNQLSVTTTKYACVRLFKVQFSPSKRLELPAAIQALKFYLVMTSFFT